MKDKLINLPYDDERQVLGSTDKSKPKAILGNEPVRQICVWYNIAQAELKNKELKQ